LFSDFFLATNIVVEQNHRLKTGIVQQKPFPDKQNKNFLQFRIKRYIYPFFLYL